MPDDYDDNNNNNNAEEAFDMKKYQQKVEDAARNFAMAARRPDLSPSANFVFMAPASQFYPDKHH